MPRGRKKDLTTNERDFKTTCHHEASHAIAAITQGLECFFIVVYDPRNGRPGGKSHEKWTVLFGFPSGAGGGAFISQKQATTEGFIAVRAPEKVERMLHWTDKSKIPMHVSGDVAFFESSIAQDPELNAPIKLLNNRALWEAELDKLLAYQAFHDARERVASAVEKQKGFLSGLEILDLTRQYFDHSLKTATDSPDFVIENYKDSIAIPFDLMKQDVLEKAIIIHMRLIAAHEKGEYAAQLKDKPFASQMREYNEADLLIWKNRLSELQAEFKSLSQERTLISFNIGLPHGENEKD